MPEVLQSYLTGRWQRGEEIESDLYDPTTGELIATERSSPSAMDAVFVVQYQPHRAGADLRRKPVACLIADGSILSRVGASDNPRLMKLY